MGTITFGSLILICIVGFAIINLILWGVEYVLAALRYLYCFIAKKPNTWINDYLSARILITRILLSCCFAMLSPKQIVKHQQTIKLKEIKVIDKKKNRKEKHHSKNKHIMSKIHHTFNHNK